MIRLFENKFHTEAYRNYRPVLLNEAVEKILSYLNEQSPLQSKHDKHHCMVDVGCGNGQSTEIFSPYFIEVHGLDASPNQIKNAPRHCQNIKYHVGKGESLPFEDESVDLVTCCEAVHWFDVEKFLAECARVLKPNGCLALVGYVLDGLSPVDSLKYDDELLPKLFMNFFESCQMHPRTIHLSNGYQDFYNLVNSKNKVYIGNMRETVLSNLEQYKNMLSTWSGYQNVQRELVQSLEAKYGPNNVTEGMLKEGDIIEIYFKGLKQAIGVNGMENSKVKVNINRKWFMILSGRPTV